jgi:ElaB/YqjD/DUF883 family membrane-anchored ribosome-binding protein
MPTNRNHLGSHARNAVSEVRAEARSMSEFAQQRAHELSDAARERALGLQRDAEDRIVQHPLTAVAIAAGIGLFCGLLFRR